MIIFYFRITHYEQRLRSLHYKKRFMIAVNDLKPRIQSVMEASREVARSRRLRKLLEVVLALGMTLFSLFSFSIHFSI